MGKLGGEACVLHCVYLFITCLFFVCVCVWFLFTLRELFVGSCINAVVWRCGERGVRGYFCGFVWQFWLGQHWLILFSYGFDAGYDEHLSFFYNLLLLLFIPI